MEAGDIPKTKKVVSRQICWEVLLNYTYFIYAPTLFSLFEGLEK